MTTAGIILAPETRPEQWVTRISGVWQQSVEAIIETGRLLIEAKASLAYGEFGKMIETELPFGARAAQMLMTIASDQRITMRSTASHLPQSWATLYELTKLDDEQFERGIAEKTIRPDMERKEVIKGARSLMGSRQEPDDSLDFFPTPPWATRALIECALPVLGIDIRPEALGCAWEPACGEGHMAEVLQEYFSQCAASDVHDYGYGGVVNFLEAEFAAYDFDWIITNPPFDDKALDFTLRALDLAEAGVAMFTRWQWIESVGRYEKLFKPFPPTMVCPFAERVPLCKGEWKPAGSTATAYCWIVWFKLSTSWGAGLPTLLHWIPPGQREALTRPDDAERFTAHPVIKREIREAAE